MTDAGQDEKTPSLFVRMSLEGVASVVSFAATDEDYDSLEDLLADCGTDRLVRVTLRGVRDDIKCWTLRVGHVRLLSARELAVDFAGKQHPVDTLVSALVVPLLGD